MFVVIVYKLLVQKKYIKRHVKDCLKINGKQIIKMPKKGENVRFKNYERKIKSPFVDFKSILVPQDNEKQNSEESYTSKYQKHFTSSYCYKFVCVDDTFSKPFKSILGENAVYNFINRMIKENKFKQKVCNGEGR